MSTFHVTLPIPPSTNALYRAVGGRAILSATGRAYKTDAGWAIKAAALVQDWQGGDRYSLTLRLWFKDRRPRDLDNILKAGQDAICEALDINDRYIDRLLVTREGIDRDNPRCEVILEAWHEATD